MLPTSQHSLCTQQDTIELSIQVHNCLQAQHDTRPPQLLQQHSSLFFYSHLRLLTPQCCNAALLGVLTATIFEFHKVSPDAAYLLLPYLGWSTFAAVLTLDIWRRNPKVTCTSSVTFAFTLPQLITHELGSSPRYIQMGCSRCIQMG